MLKFLSSLLVVAAGSSLALAADLEHTFIKLRLTDQFWAEGAHFGDFNRDGKIDIVSGPFWYEAPDYQRRHEFRPATATFKRKKADGSEEVIPGYEGALGTNNAYSDNFLTYTWDFNGDGWLDILVYGFPGKEVAWYENPKGRPGHWQAHVVFDVLDNESPGFADVTGDGKPEMICCSKGFYGYVEADWTQPAQPWTFRPLTPKGDYQRYSHGTGVGDINGDGRMDLLDKDAWWEQPPSREGNPVWKRHPVAFAPAAAQMLVYDVNGDGLNDVITCVNAHGYGLVWHEQTRQGDTISFREHLILNKDPSTNASGVQFSQVHALDLVDMDRDGLMDFVTGKRFWAHGPSGDPEPNAPAVLYWFKLTRPAPGQAAFIPQLIDADSGVGTQVAAGYITNPKYPDVVVGNKKGTFLFKHQVKPR
ncbi:MAG TPA: VCBS repeat-containing protein [Candidatus Paceibacterota bacterium]|nr:VCBS repeat-containing protein [Candidatus Paceibacterota bacterium]